MFQPRYDGDFPSLGYQLGAHIEGYLGIELTNEQQVRLVRLYRLDPSTGARIIRRAALRRPKGAGKSPEGGYTGFGELTGPVLFSHWDADGQPVGKRHPSPWVQFAAVSEDQTDNVLVWLFDVLSERKEAREELGVDLGRTRIYLKGRPGRIEPVTAAAGSREGQPISCGILDQTEAWKRENGGVRLAAVMRRNAAKTSGWTYELQNAPEPGDMSVADRTARAWEQGQTGVLFDTIQPSKIPELEDRSALIRSLREVYGEAVDREWVTLERLADECVDSDTAPSDAYRFYLNIPWATEESAFDINLWDELKRPGFVVPDGDLITLGFDGARFRDSTALVGTHVESGHQWLVGIWERPPHAADWEIDEPDVEAHVEAAFDRWDVWRLYADPPYWETAVDRWAGRWENVAPWWTNRTKPMAYALKAYTTAMRSRELSHSDDPRLTAHIRNARRKETPQARDEEGRPLWTIRKSAPDSPLKIDAAMAACLSWEARGDAIAAGATAKRESVYETRGMTLV